MKTQNVTLELISEQGYKENVQEQINVTKNSNLLRTFRRSYPNLQYSCPSCGMFDVILDLQNPDLIKAHCLDCKKRWMEEYLN